MIGHNKHGNQVITTEIKVFAEKLRETNLRNFMNFNKKWLPWNLAHFWLGTVSENVRNSDCYQHAKFHTCIKKCPMCLKFQVMLPD